MSNTPTELEALNVESVLQILRMRDFVPRFPPKTRLRVMKGCKNPNEEGKKRRKKKKESSGSISDTLIKEVISMMIEDKRRNKGSEDEKAESSLFDEQTLYNTARNSFEYGETASENEIQERVKAIMEKEKRSRSTAKFNETLEVVLKRYGLKQ